MKLRVLFHLAFWGFFILLFLQQNPDADLQDYASWFIVLGISAVVVYVNLYLLFPIYFFKKKYLIYLFILLSTILAGSIFLKLVLSGSNDLLNQSVFQNFINLFFFVVITSSFKFFREYSRKQELLIKAENEQLKTEFSLLKSQVNPHFLFNTLNNLNGLIVQNQNEKASEVTIKLSDLMRYVLESSKTEKVSLNKEIKFLNNYLSLEKIRLSKDKVVAFEVSGIEQEIFIAPLLFIPIVENAFKHGLNTISVENFAHFSLSVQGNDLFFEAQNSIGKNTKSHVQSGIGLENLQKRLKLIYPERHQLEVEETKTRFKVTLHLQL